MLGFSKIRKRFRRTPGLKVTLIMIFMRIPSILAMLIQISHASIHSETVMCLIHFQGLYLSGHPSCTKVSKYVSCSIQLLVAYLYVNTLGPAHAQMISFLQSISFWQT